MGMRKQVAKPGSSWSSPSPDRTSPFVRSPIVVQPSLNPDLPPSPAQVEEMENETFNQHKFEATKLEIQAKHGSITPEGQERLNQLQAKMDAFWEQRLARTQNSPNLLQRLIDLRSQPGNADEQATPVEQPLHAQLSPTPGEAVQPPAMSREAEALEGESNEQTEELPSESEKSKRWAGGAAPPEPPNVPKIQRQTSVGETAASGDLEESIQRQPESDTALASPESEASAASTQPAAEAFDALVREELESFLDDFSNITVTVRWVEYTDTQCVQREEEVSVSPPYFINVNNERKRKAFDNREKASREVQTFIRNIWRSQRRGGMGLYGERIGKSTPEGIQTILQNALDRHLVPAGDGRTHPNTEDLRNWLVRYGIGVDCSGFVSQALNRLMPSVGDEDYTPFDLINTGSGSFRGGTRNFTRVSRPGDLRPGDTMHLAAGSSGIGHIRIITSVENTADGAVEFSTAESSSQADVGPTSARWRYPNPDAFEDLQRPDGESWTNITSSRTITYGRYRRLEASREAAIAEASGTTTQIQQKATVGETAASVGLEETIERSRGNGQPLADNIRGSMEQAFGADFSGVKVHADGDSDRLNRSLSARAFTTGQDIFFKQGEYQPGSKPGQELLAHELTHVVQQTGAIKRKSTSEQPKTQKVHQGKKTESQQTLEVSLASEIIQRREGCDSSGVCWSEAGPDESFYSEEPNAFYSTDVGTLTEPTQAQEEDPNKPVFEAYKGKSINKIGHVSAPMGQYTIAKTSGVNVRAKPDGTLPHIAKVVYDTEVQVQALDNIGAFYFIIANTGAVGWINKDFVALDPPDVGSQLHHITESNLTTILKNEYVDQGLWTLSTGNDYTTLAAAVVVANEGRKGVSVDWEKAQKYKSENTLKQAFDPWTIDNFAIYHGSTILKGHNIWLPSPDYVRMLQSSGVIGSRPGWIDTAVDIGKGITGFSAGIVSGVFGSLWDTLTGLWELGKGIVSAVKSALDGSLFASIQSIYDTVTNMTWEDFKNMVDEVITMGKNAFTNFMEQWEHPDTYKKWHFRGYTIGAIALEVVLAIFTGGGTLGAKVLAKIGKYFPKLMGVLNKLLKVADDLDFRRRRDKGRGDQSKDREDDRDRDKDDENMSNDDRAWEQARAMAALVTEEHDARDTPVEQLIPLLNATIAVRYKGVSSYRAIPQSAPNTYTIIQTSRQNNVVDKHYTEKKKEFSYINEPPLDWPTDKFDDVQDLPKFKGKPLKGKEFEIFESLPHGVVYDINGTKVWRDPSGIIQHETTLGASLGKRASFEKEMWAQGEHGNLPPIPGGWDRAHSLGQGTGFESPFGIFYAPSYVNKILQNNGIELYMRTLAQQKLPNTSYKLSTKTMAHSGSLRLKKIHYRVEVEVEGKQYPFFEYTIQVEGLRDIPTVIADPIEFADNPIAKKHRHLLEPPPILEKAIKKNISDFEE